MKKKFALMLAVSMAVGTVLTGCGDAAGKAADTQANEAESAGRRRGAGCGNGSGRKYGCGGRDRRCRHRWHSGGRRR